MGIELNGPRTVDGALGFMSHVSMCEAPPLSQIRIVDLAGPLVLRRFAEALTSSGSDEPQNERPPATSIVRLEIGKCAA